MENEKIMIDPNPEVIFRDEVVAKLDEALAKLAELEAKVNDLVGV